MTRLSEHPRSLGSLAFAVALLCGGLFCTPSGASNPGTDGSGQEEGGTPEAETAWDLRAMLAWDETGAQRYATTARTELLGRVNESTETVAVTTEALGVVDGLARYERSSSRWTETIEVRDGTARMRIEDTWVTIVDPPFEEGRSVTETLELTGTPWEMARTIVAVEPATQCIEFRLEGSRQGPADAATPLRRVIHRRWCADDGEVRREETIATTAGERTVEGARIESATAR